MYIINRRCMRRKVTVVIGSFYLSVCLSVATKSAAYLVYTLKVRCRRVLCGVFKDFVVWLSLKTLPSRVLASSVPFTGKDRHLGRVRCRRN